MLWLTPAQRKRIESAQFYELLQREIATRFPHQFKMPRLRWPNSRFRATPRVFTGIPALRLTRCNGTLRRFVGFPGSLCTIRRTTQFSATRNAAPVGQHLYVGIYARPSAHLPTLATRAGLGTIPLVQTSSASFRAVS